MVCATKENTHPIHGQDTSVLKNSRLMSSVAGCLSWLYLCTESFGVLNLSWLVWWGLFRVFILFVFSAFSLKGANECEVVFGLGEMICFRSRLGQYKVAFCQE